NNVVNGTSATTFDPDSNITREQMVAMLYRYSKQTVQSTDAVKAFKDAGSITEYAVPAVAWAVQNGIVNGMGNGTFAPQGLSTRAQLAAVLNRYMELKK
ncbi:MAG: S-layer homology domain-containing protein, partial [Oscillospiraceae bacterium]|nr:S-layer homology domain-containing protein [Oscillospiraceae bacterium]